MATIADAVSLILARRQSIDPRRGMLVAISGIDGAGKGYITDLIADALRRVRPGVASINIDGWLELPERRFSADRPGEHFYEHAFRFPEMFDRLVVPLKENRSHRLEADLADATNSAAYQKHTYDFRDVDIILLEGIFLLKLAFRAHYDVALWVECSFATALARALRRGQEGLSTEDTIRDYESIYFSAERIHLANDNPRAAADLSIDNDSHSDGSNLVTAHGA